MTNDIAAHLAKAGIMDADSLLQADADTLAVRTGLEEETIRRIQTQIRKRREVIKISAPGFTHQRCCLSLGKRAGAPFILWQKI